MIENQPGSSWDDGSHDQTVPGDFPEQGDDPPIQSKSLPESEEEVEQRLLIRLSKEGGVKWTYKDILRIPTGDQVEWKQACHEELESLRRLCVYKLVDPPKGRKVIKNCWVFNLKSDGRKKARLVAKGFSQVKGIGYDEIFSPVVRFETVRMMIALAALKYLHISGLDIKTAFL